MNPKSISSDSVEVEMVNLPDEQEYCIISDKTSEVIISYSSPTVENPLEAVKELARLIRRANGEVTVFKATKY